MVGAENQAAGIRGEDSAMKCPNKTAQGFSPGFTRNRMRPERATDAGSVLVELHESYRRNLVGERTFVGRPFRAESRWQLTQG